MTCTDCGKNLRKCTCPDVTARLRKLIQTKYVYVGNIVVERIASGLNSEADFAGLNIHHPFASMIEAASQQTLADVVEGAKA